MIVPENRVAMAPRDQEESMDSTIIHRFHDHPQPLVPKNQPLSTATFAHVNFIFLIVGSGALLVVVDRPWSTRVLLGPSRVNC